MNTTCLSRRERTPAGKRAITKVVCTKTVARAGNLVAGLLVAILISATLGDMVHAEDSKVYIYTNDPWPPRIIYDNKSGTMSGIDIEIIRKIAKAADFEVRYTNTPWKRSLLMMKLGTADIVSSCQRRPDREKYMHFLEPPYIANSAKSFYLLREKETRIKRYEDIYGLTVGVNLGYHYFSRFDNDTRVTKHSVKKEKQLIDMLLLKRIDTFIGTEMIIDYLLIKGGYDKRIVRSPFTVSEPSASHIAISKHSGLAKKLPVLQQTMRRMVKNGVIDQIIRDYFVKLKAGTNRDGEGVPSEWREKPEP